MMTFEEWLQHNHPEVLDEDWKDWLAGGLAALTPATGAFASDLPSPEAAAAAQFAGGRPTATQTMGVDTQAIQDRAAKDQDAQVKGGILYVKGTADAKDNSPQGKMNARRVAESKAMRKAVYIYTGKAAGQLPSVKTIADNATNTGWYIVIGVPLSR
jgi:hypothetical protein